MRFSEYTGRRGRRLSAESSEREPPGTVCFLGPVFGGVRRILTRGRREAPLAAADSRRQAACILLDWTTAHAFGQERAKVLLMGPNLARVVPSQPRPLGRPAGASRLSCLREARLHGERSVVYP